MSAHTYPIVKICGVRTPAQAVSAARAGADLLGLVFYPPSPRSITLPAAEAIARAVRETGATTGLVGLFVNEPPAFINRLVRNIGLDLVQLSGDEPDSDLDAIDAPLLRAMRVRRGDDAARVRERLAALRPLMTEPAHGPLSRRLTVLLDAHLPGLYGGAGVRGDWALGAELARDFPIILAGGLTPENVGEALDTVRPLGVDVSSGVETDGVKDTAKIARFIATARAARHRWRASARATADSTGPAPTTTNTV